MQRNFSILIASMAMASVVCSPAVARSKVAEKYRTIIDGQSFNVIRYVNDSVKVAQGGIYGKAQSYELRDRMRRAVAQATRCVITDDYWLAGRLWGKLVCTSSNPSSEIQK